MSGPSCKDDGDEDGDDDGDDDDDDGDDDDDDDDGDDDGYDDDGCDDGDDEDELSAAISAQVAPSFTPVASFKMVYVSPTELRQLINKEAELLPNQVDEVHAQLGEMYADRESKGWTPAEDELWEEVEEIRGLTRNPAQFQWEYWKLREVDPKRSSTF